MSGLSLALFVGEFGEPRRDHYLFPWGKPVPCDPTRHATDITWGWDQLRTDTNVSCRLHDLRHTFAARVAENAVSESTMLALMGRMSRSMLERYSHIPMTAKREAVARVTLSQKGEDSEVVPRESPCSRAPGTDSLARKRLKELVSAVGIEPTTY
jgi:hypothetical protein